MKVTAANQQDPAQVQELAHAMLGVTGQNENVELAYVDRGYTGEQPAAEAERHGRKMGV